MGRPKRPVDLEQNATTDDEIEEASADLNLERRSRPPLPPVARRNGSLSIRKTRLGQTFSVVVAIRKLGHHPTSVEIQLCSGAMERKFKILLDETNSVTNSLNEQTLKFAQSIKSILSNIALQRPHHQHHHNHRRQTTGKPLDDDVNNNDTYCGPTQRSNSSSPLQLADSTTCEPDAKPVGSISTILSLAIVDDRNFKLVAPPPDAGSAGNDSAPPTMTTADRLDSNDDDDEKRSLWLMDLTSDSQPNDLLHDHDRNIINLMRFLCKKSNSSPTLAAVANRNNQTLAMKRSKSLPFQFNQITIVDLKPLDADSPVVRPTITSPEPKSIQKLDEPPPVAGPPTKRTETESIGTEKEFDEDEDSGEDEEALQQVAATAPLSQDSSKDASQAAHKDLGPEVAGGRAPPSVAKDDGKHSMLQFALYNFREAIEKYSLESRTQRGDPDQGPGEQPTSGTSSSGGTHEGWLAGDTSTLRGSLKLIESLRSGSGGRQNAGQTYSAGGSIGGKMGPPSGSGAGAGEWTWRELAEMVKFTKTPIKRSLLRLAAPTSGAAAELNRRAVDCFAAIMQYMGDLPTGAAARQSKQQQVPGSEVECVYLILINCHNHPQLRDEVYCQLAKQTTNNRSEQPESCLRGWRLFSIVAAYFDCSPHFRPHLLKYLETAAYDRRRAYHSVALLCLQNLRKTFKYKGRKNVPSIEEIAATSAGRNSKRQIYRLPGGTERVINTKSTTVVEDIIQEICSNMLAIKAADEMLEYSLYCIADGDLYTMPLNRDEYILDITTELIKNHQQYFLIFCRSIWHYPLRLDSKLYIEVIFNQIAPDYLEGLLLVLPARRSSPGSADDTATSTNSWPLKLRSKLVKEIARLAALLHRASGTDYMPHKDEIKYLLPKPIVAAMKQQSRRADDDPTAATTAAALTSSSSSASSLGQQATSGECAPTHPGQWVELVQANWREMSSFDTLDAKAQFLDIIRHWPLFGSAFFAIKLIQRDLIQPKDFILALNKLGVQMLDLNTHETIHKYPFNEVVSTRKVRSEDGNLFLDMKCGNLMKRTIIRIQTDQAHEISRLIRQYIDIELLQGAGSTGGSGSEQPQQQRQADSRPESSLFDA